MMNMVSSYQCCMPMNRGSLCPLSTLKSYTKKTNLCFSTPLLLGRKMPCITRSSSSTSSSSSSSSSLLTSTHPLMMIPPDEKDKDGRSLCRFYDYVYDNDVNTNIKIPKEVDDAICVGSSHGWLAYISRRDCSVFLWSPLTTSPLISLPPIHTLPSITVIPSEEVDELEGHEGSRYRWKSAYESDDDFSPDFGFKVELDYPRPSGSFYTRSAKRLILHFIRKIVLSSIPTSEDCIVVALPGLSIHRSIAFCKPGDKSWTFVDPPLKENIHHISDVIHFKDQLFYTISSCGTSLYAYDLADLSSPKSYLVETSFGSEPLSSLEENERRQCVERHYLVESLGDLLLVCRFITNKMNDNGEFIFSVDDEFPDKTVSFDVLRLDFSRNTWEYIECIGDQVLFLGTNQSLSLSAREFSCLKANRIYFTEDSCKIHRKYPTYGGHVYGYYELGGSLFGGFCRFGNGKVLPPPFWVMRHFR